MENKRTGEESELAFCLRAIQHGLNVAVPWGDSAKYDVVVDAGTLLWRVQVKSTGREGGRNDGSYLVGFKHTTKAKRYSITDADFVAAHIRPLDVWYILPMSVAASVLGISVRPLADNISRYAQYEEAWHLFHTPNLPPASCLPPIPRSTISDTQPLATSLKGL